MRTGRDLRQDGQGFFGYAAVFKADERKLIKFGRRFIKNGRSDDFFIQQEILEFNAIGFDFLRKILNLLVIQNIAGLEDFRNV